MNKPDGDATRFVVGCGRLSAGEGSGAAWSRAWQCSSLRLQQSRSEPKIVLRLSLQFCFGDKALAMPRLRRPAMPRPPELTVAERAARAAASKYISQY